MIRKGFDSYAEQPYSLRSHAEQIFVLNSTAELCPFWV